MSCQKSFCNDPKWFSNNKNKLTKGCPHKSTKLCADCYKKNLEKILSKDCSDCLYSNKDAKSCCPSPESKPESKPDGPLGTYKNKQIEFIFFWIGIATFLLACLKTIRTRRSPTSLKGESGLFAIFILIGALIAIFCGLAAWGVFPKQN